MRTRVVGVTFSNEDGSSRTRIIAGMSSSDQICLERDPYNQYDSNAVKVCVLKNGEKKQIGFLAKEIAAEVSPKLRKNVNFNITIEGVGLWNDRPFCEIEITEIPTVQKPQTTIATSAPVAGPAFTPKPKTPQAPISGPTFSPKPKAPQAPASGPTFTPKPKTPQTPASGPTFTPKPKAPLASASEKTPRKPIHSQPKPNTPIINTEVPTKNSNSSGCFGLAIGIVVVISAICMI